MAHIEIIRVLQQYIAILKENGLNIQKAFLYGSFARNEQSKDCDIDVMLISAQFETEDIEEKIKAWLYVKKVDIRIEPFTIGLKKIFSDDDSALVSAVKMEELRLRFNLNNLFKNINNFIIQRLFYFKKIFLYLSPYKIKKLLMKFIKIVSIIFTLSAFLSSCGNGSSNLTDKKDSTATAKTADVYDSVITMDKETGKVLNRNWVKRDSTTKSKPGDTIDNAIINEKNGEIMSHQLIIYKK